MNRMMAPLRGPHKSAGFAGEKAAGVRGSVPFGAAMDSTGFFSHGREVLPQRGHDLPDHSGKVIRPGSTISILAPGATRQKPSISREEV
jgi:hypothetical protein